MSDPLGRREAQRNHPADSCHPCRMWTSVNFVMSATGCSPRRALGRIFVRMLVRLRTRTGASGWWRYVRHFLFFLFLVPARIFPSLFVSLHVNPPDASLSPFFPLLKKPLREKYDIKDNVVVDVDEESLFSQGVTSGSECRHPFLCACPRVCC